MVMIEEVECLQLSEESVWLKGSKLGFLVGFNTRS